MGLVLEGFLERCFELRVYIGLLRQALRYCSLQLDLFEHLLLFKGLRDRTVMGKRAKTGIHALGQIVIGRVFEILACLPYIIATLPVRLNISYKFSLVLPSGHL